MKNYLKTATIAGVAACAILSPIAPAFAQTSNENLWQLQPGHPAKPLPLPPIHPAKPAHASSDAAPALSGNAECYGDNSRQDVTCRPLTERFLLGLRNATADQVQEAMGVLGRNNAGTHFMSNYQGDGSGDINFIYDGNGLVTIIFGRIETADGEPHDFMWNRKLLPGGCSDMPHSQLSRC